MQAPLLFDAVLFDLDGTLVATDRFWVQAARTGARRALAELGIERELPDRGAWIGLIGQDIREGFRRLFADLDEEECRRVREACEEEEHRLIAAGGASLMPGARPVLEELSAHGIRIGIASNCSRGYLDQMMAELDLGGLVEDAYCLDTAGIGRKSDMVARHLTCFETRSAVMVGDRLGDRDAAWRQGVPHVHCAFGFAGDEQVEAEGRIEDLGELLPLLGGRARWIEETLAELAAPVRGVPASGVIGITGDEAAGKSLFARDAARLLGDRGHRVVCASMEAFRRPGPITGTLSYAPEALYDLDRLDRELLEPHAERREGGDAVLLLEGPFLLEPRIHSRLDRVLHLEADEELRSRRLQARDAELAPASFAGREQLRRALREHRERFDPHRLADRVLDASNPLGTAWSRA